MHTKKCAQLGLCIGNALVTSASVVHIWALHRKSVFSCSSSHLGSATYFSYFGCSLCTFGLCIGNALVSSAAVCAHLGSASEMHWSLQLRSCGLCIGNALVFFSFGPAGSASEMHWFLRLQFCTLGICKMHWFSSASFSFRKVAHRTASGSANRKGR